MSGRDTIVVISSHVARGAVGNRVIVPVLEAAGYDVWALPTVVLPYHPGLGRGTRLVPEAAVFDAMLDELLASGVGSVRAIVSGYLGAPQQADAVARFVQAVKAQRAECRYICDPVMGDNRGLYVPEATAAAMRDVLVPLADVITPNRYEHDWLTGQRCDVLADWVVSSKRLAPPVQIITSAPGGGLADIGNLMVTGQAAHYCGHAQFDDVPHGTGDLVSGLAAMHCDDARPPEVALARITGHVFDAVRTTYHSGADDLDTRPASGSTDTQLQVHRIEL
ncbi:MAG: bifunctional hydroxymethylpyrimidine kinase/phosphomethylpyrimidine kinase [Ahrensia sp.]